ncbi:hypothetical protein MYCTH_2129999 [Thermothelomyces thermophilus ATCC 42464]|uniref:CCHC-type domain-containing protein n=1 Tax=Thermothelomyces thermophilus (strain ATCC 42464 / BCRC 31852 / DSM 1799) TaxID=573729 RepID=G2QLM6_THET4|nr:uncharacterized protein MYCTH_2129999 [Thermothelomyces thermophilus ATCC 42464]AEO60856.1 hypothetical protein MYCTH_2129999 [Thermothelomyces thermophilus ATCC 42464]
MVQNGGDFDLDIDMATDQRVQELDQRDKAAQARIKELENREKYSQKLVNKAYAKIEALEGAKAKRIKVEPPGKYRGTKEDLFPDDKAKVLYVAIRLEGKALRWFEPTWNDYLTEEDEDDRDTFTQAVFRSYDRFEEELRKLNDEALMQLFYNGLKEKVKDELYKYDRPETLDEYIAQAIRIDDRLYIREQQKRGRINGTTVKANDKKKRAYVSTSYRTHPGAIDVDAAQKQDQKKTTKDKSNVTCYNYGKKGHYKQECRSPKKGWKPTPGKEITAIDETTKDVIEVAATSYEDKGSDTDSLGYDGNGEDEQAPNSELSDEMKDEMRELQRIVETIKGEQPVTYDGPDSYTEHLDGQQLSNDVRNLEYQFM